MFATCPYCGNRIPGHGECCRIPAELDRFQRVFSRLAIGHDYGNLENRLAYYLRAYGRVEIGLGGA